MREVLDSPGAPLDAETRSDMESRFHHEFSRVRVHADAKAARSAREINALAYTVGQDVVFGAGQYAPRAASGRWLLAHELVHAVQQKNSAQGSGPLPVQPADAQSEREASAVAARVAAGAERAGTITAVSGRRIQRATSVEDCSEEHAAATRSAASAAGPAIRNTISKILAPTPTAETNAALTTYFGASAPSHAGRIAYRLALIAVGLSRAMVECENPGSFMYDRFCGSNIAYVRSVPAYFGLGNIHICQPRFHGLTPVQRMATLVHEAAHRYINADDEAYYTLDCAETPATRALSDSDRRDNADSYGCLVQVSG